MAGKAKYIIIGVVGGLVGAVALAWVIQIIYENQQSSSQNQPGAQRQTARQEVVPQDYDVPLFSDNMALNAGAGKYHKVRIDISDKTRNVIEGSLVEQSGHGINFLILDTKNYNAWDADNSSMMPYVRQKNVVTYDFSFIPDHSDDYYFVFDNRNSIFTNKLVQASAHWKYRQ